MVDAKTAARWLAHCETAATWYINNQCSDERPWGGVRTSADNGRFLYEVFRGTRDRRGAGNWAQALAILTLLDLSKRTGKGTYRQAALYGARYLISLQNLDSRNPQCSGGMWEHYPCEGIGMSRDMTTGCFGLAGLALHTGDEEYRERTRLFCDWYITYGTREDGWPWRHFDYQRRRGFSSVPGKTLDEAIAGMGHVDGDWQAGGGLCLYYGSKITGNRRYLDEGFRPMIDSLCDLYDRSAADPLKPGWAGKYPVTLGNDDFALIALIAAFREWQDERYLDRIKEREAAHLSWMASDGSYPNYGSTFVCGIEHLEYLRLAREFGFNDLTDEITASLEKTAAFGMTLQELSSEDPLFFGGLWGQSDYGIERSRIHHRSTGYSINFYLKLEAHHNEDLPWPLALSAFGWDEA